MLKNYNTNRGGVDHHDWLLGKYKTAVRGKKWYCPLFTSVIDMAVVNAWLLQRFINKEKALDLLSFKRQIAVAYMKCNSGRKHIGCPSVSTNWIQDLTRKVTSLKREISKEDAKISHVVEDQSPFVENVE